jgi:hypothetical protein
MTEREQWLRYIAVLILDNNSSFAFIHGVKPSPYLVEQGEKMRRALDISLDEQNAMVQKVEDELLASEDGEDS